MVSGTIGASRTSASNVASGPSVSSSWASALACTMPRTRSWFSSSVTTSRVWPEETQRRSAVSTFSERSTVTTAGAGVMTWRASCSCRWKTPVSIPASPGSRLPPVSDCAMSTLSSSGVPPSSNLPLVRMPISAQHPVRRAVEQRDERVEDPREEVQRARHDPRATGSALLDRVDLRDLLADRDVQRRRDQVGEREGDGERDAVRAGCRRAGLEDRATAGSPRKPMPSEVSVMPSWQADRYRERSSEIVTASAAPRLPSLGLLLQVRRGRGRARTPPRRRSRSTSTSTRTARRRSAWSCAAAARGRRAATSGGSSSGIKGDVAR